MIADYFFLFIIFFQGAMVSYQDFKYGKIKNKWIISSLILGLAIYSVLAASFFLSPSFHAANGDTLNYLGKVLVNSFFSLLIGYFIWFFDLWSAGDAKLFFTLSFLLPLRYYWRSYLPYFPSFVLLINSFVPALAFLVILNIYSLAEKHGKNIPSFVSAMNLAAVKFNLIRNKKFIYFKSFLVFFLILIIFQIFRSEIGTRLRQSQILYSLFFILIFATTKFFRKILEKTWIFLSVFCFLAIYLFAVGSRSLLTAILTIKSSFISTIVFFLIIILLSHKSAKEAQQSKIPFAIWLFLGAVITIILQGSAISFLLNPYNFWQ